MKGHLVIFCTVQITYFLIFALFDLPFLKFFALVFGLNLTNVALAATGEGMTGYITKKRRLLDSLLKKKRQLSANPFAEKGQDLDEGMTDNEDAAEIGSFITILGVIQNLVKYFGSVTITFLDWEWVCVIAIIISSLPLLIYTMVFFKEEKVLKHKNLIFS